MHTSMALAGAAGPTLTSPLVLQSAARRYFGFPELRPYQEEIVRDALAGRDVIALLPTGGGKSLCFQLPAVLRPGLSVVVSPLIALMKDQVDSLTAAGIPATFLSSSLDSEQARTRLRGLREGRYRLLYVAPERLTLPGFLASLRSFDVTAFAVDEAHCISEWGHDFRPEYRRLSDLRQAFPNAPIMALSATATERVRADIAASLRLRSPRSYVASFNRANLFYRAELRVDARKQLLSLLARHQAGSGIVYAQSRKSVEQLADRLRQAGVSAEAYHAGLPSLQRDRTQEAFKRDDVRVVCATVAFGMGVHKPDVRFVVHHELPGDIESYYQETGRAGRDGLAAECVLFWKPGDAAKRRRFIEERADPADRARARWKLSDMLRYAESGACRRKHLLSYFGERQLVGPCGGCDNCLSLQEAPPSLSAARPLAKTAAPPRNPALAPAAEAPAIATVPGKVQVPPAPPLTVPAAPPPHDEALFEALRKVRRALADERDVPAYIIFSDATLRHMARDYPTDLESFHRIPGVGEKKLAEHGDTFTRTIRDHLAAHGKSLEPGERKPGEGAALL